MDVKNNENSLKVFWKYFKCSECNYDFGYDKPAICPSCKSTKIDTMLECGNQTNKITFRVFES